MNWRITKLVAANCIHRYKFTAFLYCLAVFPAVYGQNAENQDTVALDMVTACALKDAVLLDFTTDPTGNIYWITSSGRVEKHSGDGTRHWQFDQNRLGVPAAVHAGSALKSAVWYPDFRTVLFLDRSLTQLGGPLNLIETGYPEVRTIALAADGNLCLYDEVAFKLIKINAAGEKILESLPLNTLVEGRLDISGIFDEGSTVVMADSETGFYVFDVFGQFQKSIPVNSGLNQFSLENNLLWWMDDNGQLQALNLQFPVQVQQWFFPEKAGQTGALKIIPGGIATVDSDSLRVWKFRN